MPALRARSSDVQDSQDKSTMPPPSQQEEKNKITSPSKPVVERPGTPSERPASPRRLRDRRMLAGFKTDSNNPTNITSPDKSSLVKADAAPKQTGPNPTLLATPAKRAHPSAQTDDTHQPPRSILKRPAGKPESLLAPKLINSELEMSAPAQPNNSTKSLNNKSSDLRNNPSLLPNKSQFPRNDALGDEDKPTDLKVTNVPKSTKAKPKSAEPANLARSTCAGLNLTTNNKTSKSSTVSKINSVNKLAGFIDSQPSCSSASMVGPSNQLRANLIKSKQSSKSTLGDLRIQSADMDQQHEFNQTYTVSRDELESPINLKNSSAPLDPLGAINMTKSITRMKTFNILIGVTGSVAAIKLIELIRKLSSNFPRSFKNKTDNQTYKTNLAIKVVMTQNSMHFIPKEQLRSEADHLHIEEVLDDADEWTQWNKMGDPVLHIELRKWADLLLIAPLDANTMAKLANGICDNLLTCTVRAWDTSKPLIYCPAMNVHMYEHPITRQQLTILQTFGYYRVDCIPKRLACGDYGLGAMAATDTIVDRVLDFLINQNHHTIIQQKRLAGTHSFNTVSPSLSASLLEQIKLATESKSINNIGSSNQRPKPVASTNNPFMLSKNSESFYQHHLPPEDNYLDDFSDDTSVNGLKDRLSSDKVTSLQNLKAINLAHQNGIDSDHEEADGSTGTIIQANGNTRMLNSKMPKTSGNVQERLKSALFNGSPTSLSKKNSTLDPAAFISYCYNEDRDCFTCIICKNDYKNRKSMSRHLKEQHLQGNIHRCSPCGVSYKRREKLIKHNREHHCLVGPS